MTWRLMTSDWCDKCRGQGQFYDRKTGNWNECPDCHGEGSAQREMTTDEAIEHLLSRIEALEARNDA